MSLDTNPEGRVSLVLGAVWLMIVLLVVPTVQAQLPDLRVEISDTTASPGEQNTVISIFLDNYQDTVAGFNLWLNLDVIEIMEFQTDSGISIDTTWYQCLTWQDTVCVESLIVPEDSAWDFREIDTTDILIGNFDTSGTLISGWQYVNARSLGMGFDLNISAIANMPAGDTVPGFAPQQGGLLIKLLADVFDIPDTTTERTVNIMIHHTTLDHLNFSLPDGSSIGILYEPIADTNCWECTIWAGNQCLNWERMPVPPNCDTIEVCCPDSFTIAPDSVAYLDTINVILIDGSLTVVEFVCGNIDGDEAGNVNVADLTYLVAYLFQGGPEPQPMAAGNIDCQGGDVPNVADLTWLVNYLFRGGPAPCEC